MDVCRLVRKYPEVKIIISSKTNCPNFFFFCLEGLKTIHITTGWPSQKLLWSLWNSFCPRNF